MSKLIIEIIEHTTDDPDVVGYETQIESEGELSPLLAVLANTSLLSAAIHAVIGMLAGQTLFGGDGPITEASKAKALEMAESTRFPAELSVD